MGSLGSFKVGFVEAPRWLEQGITLFIGFKVEGSGSKESL